MADDTRLSFPNMPVKHWWGLRERFKKSLPGTVTADYLETTLGINESSALPLLSPLKQMGLLSPDNKTTDLAERWRHDDTYAEVCREIREAVYPEELLHAVPDPTTERAAAERWFAKKLKVGERVAQKLTAIYQLVTEADLGKANESAATKGGQRKAPKERSIVARGSSAGSASKAEESAVPSPRSDSTTPAGAMPPSRKASPSLHIDIQIHISPEAPAAQVDQIFASMAKHLYRD